MAKPKLSISPEQARGLAHEIVEAAESPALRVRLLRDVLGMPFDDPRVAETTAALDESKWVRELAADQRDEGSWGPCHTATYPRTRRAHVAHLQRLPRRPPPVQVPHDAHRLAARRAGRAAQ